MPNELTPSKHHLQARRALWELGGDIELAEARASVHKLEAEALAVGSPQLGTPHLQVNVPRSLFDTKPKRRRSERKPRRISQEKLIAAAKAPISP
jgi:hypothetical protein